jgi:hypothetical protein
MLPAVLGFLLLIGPKPMVHAQYKPSKPHSPSLAYCPGITGSYVDCFTGSTLLGPPWVSSANLPSTVSGTGAGAHPTDTGQMAVGVYAGGTFGTDQSARVVALSYSSGGGGGVRYSGPCVRFDPLTGNGYCWLLGLGSVYKFVNGGGSSTVITGCSTHNDPFSADVFELSVVGSTFTCTDVTRGGSTSVTGTDSSYTSGYPSFVIDSGDNNTSIILKFGAS